MPLSALRRCAAALVVGAAIGGCASGQKPAGSGTTTTSTAVTSTAPGPTVPACPAFGSVDPGSGGTVATSGPVLLRNVQVQASGCVDEVAFLFWKGAPAWSAAYQEAPLNLDPSGQPAPLAGAAHLVVRLQNTSGVDTSTSPPAPSYDGPTEMTPAAPSEIRVVRRLGDFEAVTTWAIGLPERRPFQVVVRGDQLVVRVAARTARTTSCIAPGSTVAVGYPSDWYAELSARWSCQYFDPDPFVVYPATDAMDWAVTAQMADASAATVTSRLTSDGSATTETVRIAGLDATVLDVTSNGQGMNPAGYTSRLYVLPTTPRAFVVSSAPAPPGAAAQHGRTAVDLIAAMVRVR